MTAFELSVLKEETEKVINRKFENKVEMENFFYNTGLAVKKINNYELGNSLIQLAQEIAAIDTAAIEKRRVFK